MFAARRTASAAGRINNLKVSITTIRGIKRPGVPTGTRWARRLVVDVKIATSIKVAHKGTAQITVIKRCLVGVKTNGRRPIKLVVMMMPKRAQNIRIVGLSFGLKIALIS